jgi:hypothetical protein
MMASPDERCWFLETNSLAASHLSMIFESPCVSLQHGTKANGMVQNLLPLLLRPLRLVLPNQRLRTLRIFLLKATHFPLVGLILAYENGRLWIKDHRTAGDSGVPKRLSRRPLARKALSSSRIHLLEEQTQAPVRSAAANSPVDHPSAANASGESIEALAVAVADLKNQVETLSALLEQKSSRVPDNS